MRITDAWMKQNKNLSQSIKEQAKNRNAFKPQPRYLLKQLLARKDHNTYEDLDDINTPTFLLGGKYDGIAPVLNMEKMHQKIDNSKLEFYEGGHLFLIQDTKAFQDIINWLIH